MAQVPQAQQPTPVGAVVGLLVGEKDEEEGCCRPTFARLQPATFLILTPFTLPLQSRRGEDDQEGEPKVEVPKKESIASVVSSRREEPRTAEGAGAGSHAREPTASVVLSRREQPRTEAQGRGEGARPHVGEPGGEDRKASKSGKSREERGGGRAGGWRAGGGRGEGGREEGG